MLKKICRRIDRVLAAIECWSLVTAVGIALLTAMANVILRKATSNFNLYWSDEVVRKVIFFSTYIGCVAAIRTGAMVRIDALPQMFPLLKKPLTILAHCAVLVFSLILTWLGWQMTMMMFEDEYARTATLNIPEWYFYAILPMVGLMMCIRTLLALFSGWWQEEQKKEVV